MGRNRLARASLALSRPIIGIDGEGWDVGPVETDEEGKDLGRQQDYGLLLAADEKGTRWEASAEGRPLSSKQCLDLILSLPKDRLIVAFSFKYDLTKILVDLPDEDLYRLNHEEGDEPISIDWNGYAISYVSSKFSVKKGNRERVVWDIFKFYQTSFIEALLLWKVGVEDLEFIAEMKEQRGEFQPTDLPTISRYCYKECVNLSILARKLTDALSVAGLDLEGKYYGAGSVGGAVLKLFGAKSVNEQVKRIIPSEMFEALRRAFFGGRFEISECGPISVPCFEYDIASAYPYQIYHIPCLSDGCGTWELTTDRERMLKSKCALVHYDLSQKPLRRLAWGPFPYRTEEGSIVFPETSGGGWVWKDEFLEGEGGWDNVRFLEAWVWTGHCSHEMPFKGIAELYIRRNRLGKNGPGIVMKLGMNSFYGKTAQTIGKAPYQNWIWAGLITSGCRAQLLRLMRQHRDMSHILMLATDGLYTTERLAAPAPLDTGTGPDVLLDENLKPKNAALGSWEEAEMPEGIFLIRPGIYFKLGETELKKKKGSKVKSRGIGTKQLAKVRRDVIQHHANMIGYTPYVFYLRRFNGMKTSVGMRCSTTKSKDGLAVSVEKIYTRRPYYGRWCMRRFDISFNPLPKRNADFSLRGLPDPQLLELSHPYEKCISDQDEETMAARQSLDELLEQDGTESDL